MNYWVLAVVANLAATAACAAIARAKGKPVGGYVLLGLLLGVIGIAIVGAQQPEVESQSDGSWKRPGRWDWLIGGQSGSSGPAITLTLVSLAVTVWFVVQAGNGSFNQLDTSKVEDAISSDLVGRGVTDVVVDCPSSMSGKPGAESLCDVTSDSDHATAKVTVENSAGDITWVILGG